MSSLLWEILIKITPDQIEDSLTCDECFILLEYLVELTNLKTEHRGDVPVNGLQQAAQRHLEHCPRCREHHLQRLREIELKLSR